MTINDFSDIAATLRLQSERLMNLYAEIEDHLAEDAELSSNYDKAQQALSEMMTALDNQRLLNDQMAGKMAELEAEIERLRKQIAEGGNGEPGDGEPTEDPDNPIPLPTFPWSIPLTVHETSKVNRPAGELVSTGVPLPEEYNVEDVAELAVLDTNDKPIPADFRPIAWWRTEESPKAVQWVVVSFLLSSELQGESAAGYRLVKAKGLSPDPIYVIDADTSNNGLVAYIDTGSAYYSVSGAGLSHHVSSPKLVQSSTEAKFQGQTVNVPLLTLRSLSIEYAGPLVAFVVVEGTLPGLAFGVPRSSTLPPGGIAVRRRYEFRAGSSTVRCVQRVVWEGTMNGTSAWLKGTMTEFNAILGEQFTEVFKLPAAAQRVDVWADINKEELMFRDVAVRLNQKLRPNRLQVVDGKKQAIKPNYEVVIGQSSVAQRGEEADAGMVSAMIPGGWVTAVLRDMHVHEPQAISISGDTLRLELASDKFLLSHHQGFYCEYAIDVRPTAPDPAILWSSINHPLRCLCPASFYSFGQISNIPEGDLPAPLARYDETLHSVIDRTLSRRKLEGMQGLMTWGLYPRTWGEGGIGTGELGTGLGGWDELYKTATFTDYWNTTKAAVTGAIRYGEPWLLDSIAFPAALRMLHTMIFNGAPEDNLSYLGSSPAGYGLYRKDFNSNHQYWESLYLYYFLTGDQTVPQTIERVTKLRTDQLSGTGRGSHQWLAALRFLSHVSSSADGMSGELGRKYDKLMEEAIRNCYLEGEFQGQYVAFWLDRKLESGVQTYVTQNLYALGYYDMESIYWFMVRTANKPVSQVPGAVDNWTKPTDVLVDTARTACTLGPALVGGDGTPAGKWARAFSVTYDAAADKILNVTAAVVDGQSLLFGDDKPAMSAWFARAASISRDPLLLKAAMALIAFAFDRGSAARGLPMGKLMGLVEGRLADAVSWEMDRLQG